MEYGKRDEKRLPVPFLYSWSGSAVGSAPFNSEAAAVGIRGTVGTVGIPGAVSKLVYLVCLVCLVCLVGWIRISTRETSEIRAQFAEIFRVDRERHWQQGQQEEDDPHGEPLN